MKPAIAAAALGAPAAATLLALSLGTTPEFWNACDAVCNRDNWQMWGTPNCGKGQPSQIIHTGHGAAPARFRGVKVGVLAS